MQLTYFRLKKGRGFNMDFSLNLPGDISVGKNAKLSLKSCIIQREERVDSYSISLCSLGSLKPVFIPSEEKSEIWGRRICEMHKFEYSRQNPSKKERKIEREKKAKKSMTVNRESRSVFSFLGDIFSSMNYSIQRRRISLYGDQRPFWWRGCQLKFSEKE